MNGLTGVDRGAKKALLARTENAKVTRLIPIVASMSAFAILGRAGVDVQYEKFQRDVHFDARSVMELSSFSSILSLFAFLSSPVEDYLSLGSLIDITRH